MMRDPWTLSIVLVALNTLALLCWRRPRGIRITFRRPAAVGVTAGAAAADLEEWIEEADRVEREQPRTEEPESAEGTEAWWRAWAASGGDLPGAADSCRSEAPLLGKNEGIA